jgi:transcriptional regulator NrdR family protein
VDLSKSLVIAKQNYLEAFSRDSLFLSVYDSLRHRKSAQEDATSLTATIIGKLITHIDNAQLDRGTVVAITEETLKQFDAVAATHYQAFHPKTKP